MRARRLGQTLLIFVPLVICGARLYARMGITPAGVTQEVARCLNMVRVAATRRCGRAGDNASDKRRTAENAGKTVSVG